jgi:hypothetical protein
LRLLNSPGKGFHFPSNGFFSPGELVMAQQHRNPHEQENQQRSGWRGRFFGDRSDEERNRESESGWE